MHVTAHKIPSLQFLGRGSHGVSCSASGVVNPAYMSLRSDWPRSVLPGKDPDQGNVGIHSTDPEDESHIPQLGKKQPEMTPTFQKPKPDLRGAFRINTWNMLTLNSTVYKTARLRAHQLQDRTH